MQNFNDLLADYSQEVNPYELIDELNHELTNTLKDLELQKKCNEEALKALSKLRKEYTNLKTETYQIKEELTEVKNNLEKFNLKQIAGTPDLLDTQKLVKLVLFNLLQAYPEGLQISSIADKINSATTSNRLTPPYHSLRLTLGHLIQQGFLVRLENGKKYYISTKVELHLF